MAVQTSATLISAYTLLKSNRVDEAEIQVDELLRADPELVPALFLRGVIRFRTGRLEEAERLLETVCRREPGQFDALSLLAVIKKSRNDFAGAARLLQKLIQHGRESPDICNQLGTCFLELGDEVAAGTAFMRAVELDRTVAVSYFNLGLALKKAGRSFETFSTFKRAAELDPNLFGAYAEAWGQMRQILNWTEGLPLMETGMKQFPDSGEMKLMLATTYGKVGQTARAEELFQSALEASATAGTTYAYWLQEEGRFDESVPILKQVIKQHPTQGQPYYNLAVAKCFEIDGVSISDSILSLLSRADIVKEERMYLHYSLAKLREHEKDYEAAMASYDLANQEAYQLYNAAFVRDENAVEDEFKALKQLFTQEAIAGAEQYGSKSTVPIFIVGMIRTGTTLLDVILSSHPEVKSAGEQPFWQVSAGRVNRRWLEDGIRGEDTRELEARYLSSLRETAGEAKRITDKMPTNFAHMGLMSIVFPRAKFIHIRRNPVDTCLSIYTTFLGQGTQFAYSQENIVSYYKDYLRTIAYWRSVIPGDRMIEIDYENLVTDKEKSLRRIIQFCGLDWNDSLLSHEENRSPVRTPSLWTARQGVNTGSVERWLRYEPWLGKLRELKDLSHPAY